MTPLNIAIIFGGNSSEDEISALSAQTIAKELPGDKYRCFLVRIKGGDWYHQNGRGRFDIDKDNFSLQMDSEDIRFDCVFNSIHGDPGENGKMAGYFEMLGIPHSSCDQLSATLTFNKWSCNTILKELGYHCADSILMRKGFDVDEPAMIDRLGLPMFVKPNNGGSSFGISKVNADDELGPALRHAFEADDEVVAEAFMDGTEVTCAVFRTKGELIALPLTEIVSENDFFDYNAKYEGASDEITPARISAQLTEEVQEITTNIYQQLNLSGVIRIDYILVGDQPHVIEVNTVPGTTDESIVPKMARAAGYSLGGFFDLLIEEALA